MTQELPDLVKRIRTLAPELNKVTDEACAVVARVETFLNDECSIGVPAGAIYSVEDVGENKKRRKWLSYLRIDGKFRLGITTDILLETMPDPSRIFPVPKFFDDQDSPPIAWSSCPRDVKLASFEKLPDLLANLVMVVDVLSKSAKSTTTVIQKILEAVDAK